MTTEFFPPSPVPIGLDTLLQPVSEDVPSGESLRYEGTYDRILEARRAERADLPQGVWKTELKAAEWDQVEALCLEALTRRSKDVQIALWLTEAWLNQYGVGGFRHGLELIQGLCERFWPTLHPEIRDGDVDYRVAPFVWLAENLVLGLNAVPLTWPRSYDDLPRCTHSDWQGVTRLEKMEIQAPKSFGKEIQAGRLTREHFDKSARDSVAEHVVETYGQFRASSAALKAVDDRLDQLCGREAPSLRKARSLLTEILGVFEQVVLPAIGLNPKSVRAHGLPGAVPPKTTDKAGFVSAEEEPVQDDDDEDGGLAGRPLATLGTNGLTGRAQAYRMLAEIADYLQATEPHSPTSYLVRRAASWENRTMLELMEELLQARSEVDNLAQFLGIGSSSRGDGR